MKKTGVVLVCYHTPEETLSCAMMYASMSCVNQIVIVDNETTEKSRKIFENIKNNKIETIYQDKNIGYSKGNNVGINSLINQYDVDKIVISNSDIEISENAVVRCLEALECHNKLGTVAPLMKGLDGTFYPLRFIELGYLRIFLRIFLTETIIDKSTQKYCNKNSNMVYQSFVPGCFFILERNAIEKCNGFDENIFLYREEEILGKRMERAGYKTAVCTDCFFIHNHNYKKETPEVKTNRNKIVMKSEQWYFQEYLKSNKIQMLYVNIMQKIYLLTRDLGWRLMRVLKK